LTKNKKSCSGCWFGFITGSTHSNKTPSVANAPRKTAAPQPQTKQSNGTSKTFGSPLLGEYITDVDDWKK
jgi:hypothetical protein